MGAVETQGQSNAHTITNQPTTTRTHGWGRVDGWMDVTIAVCILYSACLVSLLDVMSHSLFSDVCDLFNALLWTLWTPTSAVLQTLHTAKQTKQTAKLSLLSPLLVGASRHASCAPVRVATFGAPSIAIRISSIVSRPIGIAIVAPVVVFWVATALLRTIGCSRCGI